MKKVNLRKTFAFSIITFLLCTIFFSISVNSVSGNETNQIYWGTWVGTHHIGYPDLLTTFENQVGKKISIWDWIQIWTIPQDPENVPNFDTPLMDLCRQHGAIPMVSWSPAASDNYYDDDSANFTNLQSILDGKWDAYLTAWGEASHAWGHPYFIRLFWEFTGTWNDNTPSNPGYGTYPWGNGNTPAMFVAAWQYIVNKVREAGGTQITWIWCPADVGDSANTLKSVYPGDQYVDWVGTDVYTSAGQSFEQAAQPELDNIRAVAPGKPVMFPEIGHYGTDAAYWSNLLTNVLPNNFPYVKAVLLWEEPSARLTVVDSTTLPAFQKAISSNYYSSNSYSSLDTSPILPIETNSNPSQTSAPTTTNNQSSSQSTPPSVPEFPTVDGDENNNNQAADLSNNNITNNNFESNQNSMGTINLDIPKTSPQLVPFEPKTSPTSTTNPIRLSAIPEFPTLTALFLVIGATLTLIILKRNKQLQCS